MDVFAGFVDPQTRLSIAHCRAVDVHGRPTISVPSPRPNRGESDFDILRIILQRSQGLCLAVCNAHNEYAIIISDTMGRISMGFARLSSKRKVLLNLDCSLI